ncbi:unnamed protein product [Callosobruchus maculatus]|uniref:Zasp-like motif domain-containing protein n=1 Tax=Callosobruchus maculatus TaxID=64391 RepID=A0A653DWQ9_CALMS|nr:unnamed protein product [Callosobruchus maculatus]
MTVQRGGLTWRPSVTPTGHVPAPSPVISNNISPVTRTSLAAPKGDNFGAVNGSLNGGPKLVNKQYNTPVKLYSEDTIAETLAAQSEVLAPGVVGVNFKKNEKNYDASNSAVLRMLKETENEPRTPTEEPDSGIITTPNSGIAGLRHVQAPATKPAPSSPQLPPGQNICDDCERLIVRNFYSSQSHAIGGRRTATPTSEGRSNSVASVRSDNVATSSIRSEQHIATSTTKSENFATSSSNVCETSEQQVGSNVTEEDTVTICTDCERVIRCFRQDKGQKSTRRVFQVYYNINNKLYCDIHAKSAALRSNANPNLVPVTVPPNPTDANKLPAGGISHTNCRRRLNFSPTRLTGGKAPAHAISSALSTHSLPTPSPLSPKLNNSFASPYQNQELNGNAEQAHSPLPNPNSEANNNNIYSSATPLPFSKYLTKTSNLSGPRPFSSVSGPLSPHNTLPRSTGPISPVAQVPPPSYNTPIHNTPSYSPVSSTGRFSTSKPAGGLFKDRSFNTKPRPFSLVVE